MEKQKINLLGQDYTLIVKNFRFRRACEVCAELWRSASK
jgi:hypothetical protein